MKQRVLIANRGEIALRVIRACKELGVETVAVYSEADRDSLHTKYADIALCIGKASSKDSYLNQNNILSAAVATGSTAIHPGYGFLSESAVFADKVKQCNIKFIGPSADVIRLMGDKAQARKTMIKHEVPVIPGSKGTVDNINEGLEIANRIGYPVLIKAANGGGGRGMRIVEEESGFTQAFNAARLEALNCFGSDDVYIEKFIVDPHHIEIQVLADQHGNVVHLGERDCSIQRRNQKVIEECPSPYITDKIRKEMGETAVKITKVIGYEGAGTIEFIVDNKMNYYFIEMNTRIQVEHPITEMVTGVDLVKEQIKVAYGKELGCTQEDIKFRGHAIECRLNAEDPDNNFRPSPGEITGLTLPGGFGVRVDTHIYQGYSIPPHYDSMIGKLIVYGNTRIEAIRKMRFALQQTIIDGIKNNIELHYVVMHHPEYVRGVFDTGFLKRMLETER